MNEITLIEINSALKYLTIMLTITQELAKAQSDTALAITLVERLKKTAVEAVPYYSVLHSDIKESIKNLITTLNGICDTFNDIETQVFIKLTYENKSAKEIAYELGYSQEYTRHLIAGVKKRAEKILKQYMTKKDVEFLNKFEKEEGNGKDTED